MQLEIDALKEAAPERAAVETRGLAKRFRSVARLARRAGPVARRPPKLITCPDRRKDPSCRSSKPQTAPACS